MAFRDFSCEDGVPAEIFLCVATGTHNAGKSTIIDSFSNGDFALEHQIPEEDPFNLLPRYSGSLLEGTDIPIITGEEAMTAYARLNRLPNLATTQYSFERQIAVESLAQWIITDAMRKAMRVATKTQPNSLIRKGIVLTDRSALDGLPYSLLRTDNDPENVDVRKVEIATIGWDTYPSAPSRVWPLRKWSRDFMREYCDLALIADHAEVQVEDNGFRQTDVEFREEIAEIMDAYYKEVLGDRVVKIQGRPEERKEEIVKVFRNLVALG